MYFTVEQFSEEALYGHEDSALTVFNQAEP